MIQMKLEYLFPLHFYFPMFHLKPTEYGIISGKGKRKIKQGFLKLQRICNIFFLYIQHKQNTESNDVGPNTILLG